MTLLCLDPCTVTTDTAVNYKEAQPQPNKVQAAPQAQTGTIWAALSAKRWVYIVKELRLVVALRIFVDKQCAGLGPF